jgi:carboxyl-terminal processing protease
LNFPPAAILNVIGNPHETLLQLKLNENNKDKMKIFNLFFLFASILHFSSCAATNRVSKKLAPQELPFLRENGAVNPIIKGYWKSIGNGYILDAASDSILLYSYTKNFCYKEKNDHIEGLLNDKARFTLRNDTLSIYEADFGEKSTALQVKHDFIRIDGLPKNHLSFSEMQKLGARKLFALFIETLQENYAFSKDRNLNWTTIKTEFENKISDSTSEEELFQVLGQIVSLTKDHHTKIIAENGQTLQYRITPSAEIVTDVFNTQSKVKKLNDYFNLFFETNYKNISDSLLHGNGNKIANGQIEWGTLDNSVGYISIYSFTGFAPDSFSRKQQIDSVNSCMERIIAALKDKKAIIVDISFNFGGYDAAVLTIASYFTNKLKLAYTSQVYTNGTFYNESNIYIRPAHKIIYRKPVYVLMTDITRSAAEGFAMTMKANSNVKLVGTNTLGILSSMLGKSIGNFYSTSSNQRLISSNGKYCEVSGVEPDIKMTVFNKENIFGGHKEAVRKIVEIIEKQ